LEWLVFWLFDFVGQLEGWFTKTRTWLGWKNDIDEGFSLAGGTQMTDK
jgi:hypothetical protein